MTELATQNLSDQAIAAATDQLDGETLAAEKQRLFILLIIAVALAGFALIPPAVLSGELNRVFHGNAATFIRWRFIVLGFLVLYLAIERLVLEYRIRRQQRIPTFQRYITAFIETSTPTAAVIVTATFADPASGLASVPVFIYPFFIVLSALRLNFRLSLFTGAVAAVGYFLVQTFYVHDGSLAPAHISRAMALLLLGVITGLVAVQIRKRMIEACRVAEERNQIIHMFGEHVSPAVVDRLLECGPEMQSETQNVCVMFLDIRDFTSFAEKRSAAEVVTYLDTLFDFMIEIVNHHHGIINKFLGDGFMAVFGAPTSSGNDALNAVNAAREILARLKREVASGAVPPTRVGIGLHAGDAVTGSIGSALRREYTVIGDVVNVASRIEKLNKGFGSELLVSEVVRNAARDEGFRDAIPREGVQIRGRVEPIQVYQLA